MATGDFVGDNIEFTAIEIGDYTIYCIEGTDSEFTKYAQNNTGTAKKFSLRTDQTVTILKENGITFSDPITVILNKEYVEKEDVAFLTSITLRVATASTAIKFRFK